MTPKEKAIELVESMTFHCYECGGSDNAKQCALIAVRELKNNLCPYCIPDVTYYEQVEAEIKNL